MFTELLICILVLLLTFDFLNRKYRNAILKKSNIRGPMALPLIGSILSGRGLTPENLFERFKEAVKMHGKMFRVWILYQLNVNTCDPKDLEDLLCSQVNITKNSVYDMLSVWLGNGLLMSTDSKWHTRRKIITPTFHFKILEQFVDIFDQQSAILTRKLSSFADGETVLDIYPLVNLAALDIIAETAMGVTLNAQQSAQNEYVRNVKIVTELFAYRLSGPGTRIDWVFRLTSPRKYAFMLKTIHRLQQYTENIIETRRTSLQQSCNVNNEHKMEIDKDEEDEENDPNLGNKKKRMALLDVLLQSNVNGKPLSNEDIREEVETFMFAGHDTTSSAISFTLYLISRHPDVQQRLFEEIRAITDDDLSTPLTYSNLQQLKYMDCVIKESLRLYPPVPIIGRYFKHDVEINKKILPGNTHLNMFLFLALRDPEYFDEPDAFKPDRFSPEHGDDIFSFAYVPFSAGSRNCIGQRFAILEMKTIISKLLRSYELLPLGPTVVRTLSMVMRSKNGINMGLRPRQQ